MSKPTAQERAQQAIRRSQDPAQAAEVERAKQKVRGAMGTTRLGEPAKATRALSHVLDELFPIPGTKFRFGVDPILSFFPAVGTGMAAVFGTVVLGDAVRLRAPVSVLARMVFNHVVNWLLGLLPVIGPFLDAWWKSNARNVKLLDRTIKDREQVRQASVTYWLAIGVMFLVVLLTVVAVPVAGLLWLDSLITGA